MLIEPRIINGINAFESGEIIGIQEINAPNSPGQIFVDGERLGENPILQMVDENGNDIADAFGDGEFNYVRDGNDLIVTDSDLDLELDFPAAENYIRIMGYFTSTFFTQGRAPFGIGLGMETIPNQLADGSTNVIFDQGQTTRNVGASINDARAVAAVPVVGLGGDFSIRLINEHGLQIDSIPLEIATVDPDFNPRSIDFDRIHVLENGDVIIPYGVSNQQISNSFQVLSASSSAKIAVISKDRHFFVVNAQTQDATNPAPRIRPSVISRSGNQYFCSFIDQTNSESYVECSGLNSSSVLTSSQGLMPPGALEDIQDNQQFNLLNGAQFNIGAGNIVVREPELQPRLDNLKQHNVAENQIYTNPKNDTSITLGQNATFKVAPAPEVTTYVHGLRNLSFVELPQHFAGNVTIENFDTQSFSLGENMRNRRGGNLNQIFGIAKINLPGNQTIIAYNPKEELNLDDVFYYRPTPSQAASSKPPTPSRAASSSASSSSKNPYSSLALSSLDGVTRSAAPAAATFAASASFNVEPYPSASQAQFASSGARASASSSAVAYAASSILPTVASIAASTISGTYDPNEVSTTENYPVTTFAEDGDKTASFPVAAVASAAAIVAALTVGCLVYRCRHGQKRGGASVRGEGAGGDESATELDLDLLDVGVGGPLNAPANNQALSLQVVVTEKHTV